MKGVLITGGAGFIGSNFLRLFLQKISPQIQVINLDNLSYAGDLSNLRGIERHKNYHFIKGDICDSTLVAELFARFHIDGVIHFAAESHVDNSIASPEIFIKTNIQGTWNLLQIAYKSWLDAPFCPKKGFENALFHHISTDEVYGTLGKTGKFSETSPYAPNSPYSASKASSDMLVRSYAHTFGLNAVITNCSNNYGPNQHNEKLIPTIIRNALQNKQIPIYGDGQNVRDWLFVEDHCEAIMQVFDYAKGKIATMTGGGGCHNENSLYSQIQSENSSQNQSVCENLGKNESPCRNENFNQNICEIQNENSDFCQNSNSQIHSKNYKENSSQNENSNQIFNENKVFFECFNIGGNEEKHNIDIAKFICTYLDKRLPKAVSYAAQIRFVKDRAGHDRRYAIDASKLRKTLGFTPRHSFEEGISKTIEFYIEKYSTQKEQTEFG